MHPPSQGDGVEYTEVAEEQIEAYTKAGYAHLPVCIAKTQYRCVCVSDRLCTHLPQPTHLPLSLSF